MISCKARNQMIFRPFQELKESNGLSLAFFTVAVAQVRGWGVEREREGERERQKGREREKERERE